MSQSFDRIQNAQQEVRKDPTNPLHLLQLAKSHHASGNWEAARVVYNRLSQIHPTPEVKSASVDLEIQHDEAALKGVRYRWVVLAILASAAAGVCLLALNDPEFRVVADDVFAPPENGYEVALGLSILVGALSLLVFLKTFFSGLLVRKQARLWDTASLSPCGTCDLTFPASWSVCPHCGSGGKEVGESSFSLPKLNLHRLPSNLIGRPILGIILLVVFLGLGGFFFLRDPMLSSLNQIVASIRDHDLEKFHRYVELETLVKRGIDQVVQEISQSPETETDGFMAGLLLLFSPTMADKFVTQIETLIETGRSDLAEEFGGDSEGGRSNSTGPVWEVADTRTEGKIGYIDLKFFHQKFEREMVVTLKMRQDAEVGWKLIEIEAAKAYRELDRISKEWADEKNAPTRLFLDRHCVLAKSAVAVASENWDDTLVIEAAIENRGEHDLREFGGSFDLLDMTGNLVETVPVEASGPLPKGTVSTFRWTKELNRFLDDVDALKAVYDARFHPHSAVLEDGQRFEIVVP